MKKLFKLFIVSALIFAMTLAVTSCDDFDLDDLLDIFPGSHTHDFDDWDTTKTPTCTENGEKTRYCDCGEKQSETVPALGHSYTDGICTVCKANASTDCAHANVSVVKGTPNTCTEIGYTDGEVCDDCGTVTLEKQVIDPSHTIGSDGICTRCGIVGPNGKYPWCKTDVTVTLCESSWFNEYAAGLKRYCAGQGYVGTAEIDILVRNRNVAAYADTNVNVTYQYENTYGYGGMYQRLISDITSGTAFSADIISNFTYDMTYCAMYGFFANLYANTDIAKETYGNGENYFAFAKDGYSGASSDPFDQNSGEGYFIDYMRSLTFVNEEGVHDKMYLLASNYTMDFVRAMQIIPVNANLLSGISSDALPIDSNENGKIDMTELYSLVWNYGWTYDTLAALANAVYEDENTAIGGKDIGDVLGFCLAESNLPASGLLYSSGMQVINKVQDYSGWRYEYPMSCEKLSSITTAVSNLITNNDGVHYLSNYEATNASIGNVESSLEAIHYRFADDKLLFGGITPLGTFEDPRYNAKNNSGESGFGFVPIPIYTQVYDGNGNVDVTSDSLLRYNTSAYNGSRVFAINTRTTVFEQCTALLDYLSTNSADIVDMYGYSNLVPQNEIGDNSHINVKMLTYAKNHTRTAFEKTYDQIIRNDNPSSGIKTWQELFYLNRYFTESPDMIHQLYMEAYPQKQNELEEILSMWKMIRQDKNSAYN